MWIKGSQRCDPSHDFANFLSFAWSGRVNAVRGFAHFKRSQRALTLDSVNLGGEKDEATQVNIDSVSARVLAASTTRRQWLNRNPDAVNDYRRTN